MYLIIQISFFLGDYSNSMKLSQDFDSRVQTDSQMISKDYAIITAISARQAFAGVEVTVSKSGNSYNTSDVYVFYERNLL